MTISQNETQEVTVVAVDAIVPEGAVITPEPALALKPEELASEQAALLLKLTSPTATDEPVTTEATDAVVPEVAATEALKPAPVQQSRLSLAFHKISCGLCLSPVKGGSQMDYHSLVITPTDEDSPLLGEDGIHHSDDGDGFTTTVITEDYKETHEGSYVGASSSTEHHLSSLGESETKAENSNSEVATSTIIEEITIAEGSADEVQEVIQETVLSRETETAAVVSELDAEQVVTLLAVQEPQSPQTQKQKKDMPSTKSGGSTPNAIRSSRPFAKLIKRSSSSTNVPPLLPSSPTNSSPLGRLGGRIAKIIRQNETQPKGGDSSPAMQEVKRTNIISSAVSGVTTAVIEQESSSVQTQDVQIDFHETVMSDDDDDDDEAPLSTAVISEDPFAQYASPPFQPFFKRSSSSPSKRMSVVVDTATQPVAIPRQSATSPSQRQSIHSWAQSPTLHHAEDSAMTAGSGHSLVKAGRSSTVGSTVGAGSETGSVGSSEVNILATSVGAGKDSSDGADKLQQKRRGSVLKKIGKIIKNNKDKIEEKRLSRQGSAAMSSPVEVEENSRGL